MVLITESKGTAYTDAGNSRDFERQQNVDSSTKRYNLGSGDSEFYVGRETIIVTVLLFMYTTVPSGRSHNGA
jgi:hypothetical protein